MGFYEGLEHTVQVAGDTFGFPATYTTSGGTVIPDIIIELHPITDDIYVSLDEREMNTVEVYHRAKVAKQQFNPVVEEAGANREIRIAKFKVSDVPDISPGDFITINSDKWIII